MRKILYPAMAALMSSACVLSPQTENLDAAAAGTVPASAEPLSSPTIEWNNTGRDGWFYHHVGGGCDFLEHGHGRNNAWGLARLPLGKVRDGGIVSDGDTGFEIRYTCKDAGACIQTGALEETPNRADSYTIPFQTYERAEEWLTEVKALELACAARR